MKNFIFSPIQSFYRNNLYNSLSNKDSFTVIYLNNKQDLFRSKDFIVNNNLYKKVILSEMNLIMKILYLAKIIFNSEKKNIFISGWDKILYWVLVLFSVNSKKILICDSFENINNFHFLKKFFLKQVDQIIVPGKMHEKFIKNFGINKKIYITKSVGLLHNLRKKRFRKKVRKNVRNIIFVGRISREKNICLLKKLIEKNKKITLSIYGEDFINFKEEIRHKYKDRIFYYGSKKNKIIISKIQNYDLLILPSKFEPWGLVIEEAIFSGIPVLVSSKVGCHKDLVEDYQVGKVFKNNSFNSLQYNFKKISEQKNLNKIYENLKKLNYKTFRKKHLKIYNDLLNS